MDKVTQKKIQQIELATQPSLDKQSETDRNKMNSTDDTIVCVYVLHTHRI